MGYKSLIYVACNGVSENPLQVTAKSDLEAPCPFYAQCGPIFLRVHAVGFDDTGKRRDVEAVLSPADRDVIERAAADVDRRLGGRAFEAPVIDGEGMIIHFGGLGEHTDRDIILHNAWVPQAAPLIIAVARVAPAEMPLRFAQRLARLHADEPPMPVQVLPIADVRDEHPQLPWWCAWRQWLNPQLTSPNVITGTSYIPDPLRYVYRDE